MHAIHTTLNYTVHNVYPVCTYKTILKGPLICSHINCMYVSINTLVCIQECGVGGADEVSPCVEGPVLLHGRSQHAVPHHLGHQLVH